MEMNVRMRLVLNTLNGISVSGEENLERLLGSIQEVKKIVSVLENSAPSVAEAEVEMDGR